MCENCVVREFNFPCSIREYRRARSFRISYTEYCSERILRNETRRGEDRFVHRSTFNGQRRLLQRTKKLSRRFGMNYRMQRDWPAARNNRIRDNCESFPERRMAVSLAKISRKTILIPCRVIVTRFRGEFRCSLQFTKFRSGGGKGGIV